MPRFRASSTIARRFCSACEFPKRRRKSLPPMQSRKLRTVLVERAGQALERLRGDFAGHAGAHDAAADQLFELRRVAFLLVGARPEGETVAEREHHGVVRKARKPGAIATGRGEKQRRREEAN